MEEITISIDCYQCGEKLTFPFRLFRNHAEYMYCPICQEGVQIYLNGSTLEIDKLTQK